LLDLVSEKSEFSAIQILKMRGELASFKSSSALHPKATGATLVVAFSFCTKDKFISTVLEIILDESAIFQYLSKYEKG